MKKGKLGVAVAAALALRWLRRAHRRRHQDRLHHQLLGAERQPRGPYMERGRAPVPQENANCCRLALGIEFLIRDDHRGRTPTRRSSSRRS